MSDPEIFAEISVLLNYVRTYSDKYYYSNQVLNNFNGSVLVSKFAGRQFTNQFNNRVRLFKFLFREIARTSAEIEDSEEEYGEEEKIEMIIDEVLTFEDLKEAAPMGLNDTIEEDLDELREMLRESGIDAFLTDIESLETRVDEHRERLERKIINSHIDVDGSHKMLEVYIDNTVENKIQAKNLVEAAFWNRDSGEGFVLSDLSPENCDGVRETISDTLHYNPDIYSPREIIEDHHAL